MASGPLGTLCQWDQWTAGMECQAGNARNAAKEGENMNSGDEAAAVAFTNFKRTDGFEISLTLRGDTGTQVLERLSLAIEQLKQDGCEPLPFHKGFAPKPAQKPIEYVPDRLCPTCGSRLIYGTKKDGSRFIKCETNKYVNGQATGCPYVDWGNTKFRPATKKPLTIDDYTDGQEDINF